MEVYTILYFTVEYDINLPISICKCTLKYRPAQLSVSITLKSQFVNFFNSVKDIIMLVTQILIQMPIKSKQLLIRLLAPCASLVITVPLLVWKYLPLVQLAIIAHPVLFDLKNVTQERT